MRVVVILLCLIHYVYGENCMVTPDANGHVSAADLITVLDGETIIGTTSTDYSQSGFYECNALQSIEIPASVTTIKSGAFYRTHYLKNITFLGDITTIEGGIISPPGAFSYSGWSAETMSITFKGTVGTIGERAFYYSGPQAKPGTMSITFMGTVGTINNYAFQGSGSNADFSVDFQGTVQSIGNYAFQYSGIISFTYDGNLPLGSNVFYGSQYDKCRQDETPPGVNLATGHGNYTGTSDSFDGCKHLKSVTIADSVEEIGSSAFYSTTALTSVTIPSSVTKIGNNAFYNSGVISITYEGNVDNINIASNAFEYSQYELCRLDETPPGVNLATGHGTYNGTSDLFDYCRHLTSVTIPSSVTEIGSAAFRETTALTSVTIPDSVTTISSSAFYKSGLTSVIIPSSVITIGDSAFKDSALTSATVPVCTHVGTDAFPSATNVVKYFSRSCLDNYVAEGITYADILDSFTPDELKAAYRAKGSCPN